LGAVSGCNTMAGAGQDIERGGQKVEGAARDVQRKM
jgi:predicted small secreted protein